MPYAPQLSADRAYNISIINKPDVAGGRSGVVWHDIFVAGVPLLERVVRAALIYVFAVVALRVAGKRELGQLSTFDLVVLLFFSNILQNAVIGADNSVTGGVVGATTFLALNYLVARADV